MDLSLYDQLSRFICTYLRLDPFNYYFLGICYRYAPESMPLDRFFIQLSSSFSSFSKDSLLKRIHETKAPLNSQMTPHNLQNGSSIIILLENDKNFNSLLKDFDILPKLFSKISKAQWFYLGRFMAKNPSFNIVDFLREEYSQLCVNPSKYKGEHPKANLLASLLKKALKNGLMNLEPEQTIPKREGKDSNGFGANEASLKQLPNSKTRLRKNQQHTMEEEEEKVNNITCPICLGSMSEHCNITLSNCQHSFHLQCLQDYLQEMTNGKRFPIRCAMDGCASLELENEMLENLDKNYQEKFDSFTLKHFVETYSSQVFSCPSADCEYFAFVDKQCRHFQCEKCKKEYCMECGEGWHGEMSCEQAEFSGIAKKNRYRQCSSCHMYIEKNGGCSSMVCRCKYHFIWGS